MAIEFSGNGSLSRRNLMFGAAQVAALGMIGAYAIRSDATEVETSVGISDDFDFLFGRWRVFHRTLRERSPGRFEWQEADGECVTQALLGGGANCDDHVIHPAAGTYRAVGLRAFDSRLRRWAIWWLDSRFPHRVDPPMLGTFSNGAGAFYGDDILDGHPIRVRFLWTRTGTPAPRWEQAYSRDAGATWETNWTMDFTRLTG